MKEVKEYYSNGQLCSKYFCKDNKLEGEYLHYHENGQLFRKYFLKNGKREGEYLRYYSNGRLYSKRFYKDGKLFLELSQNEIDKINKGQNLVK